jgi:hypothetical protein
VGAAAAAAATTTTTMMMMMMGDITLIFFQKVGKLLPDDRASQPRRQNSSELAEVFKMHTQAVVAANMAPFNSHTGEVICITTICVLKCGTS